MPAASNPSLRRNDSQHRFEIEAGGQLAGFVVYREHGGKLDLVHTEVLPAFEGRGLASQLARFALDEARRGQRKVIASCSYIAGWIEKHPDYQDLLG